MASKSKTSGTKRRKSDPPDKEVQKTQRERFIETARKLGVDESGKDFDTAAKKILKPKAQAPS